MIMKEVNKIFHAGETITNRKVGKIFCVGDVMICSDLHNIFLETYKLFLSSMTTVQIASPICCAVCAGEETFRCVKLSASRPTMYEL